MVDEELDFWVLMTEIERLSEDTAWGRLVVYGATDDAMVSDRSTLALPTEYRRISRR